MEGTIESITPPTLRVAGRTVVTNGSTEIEVNDKHGTLGDLKVGMKAEVKGTRQADGSVLARKIQAESDDGEHDDDDGDNEDGENEGGGGGGA